MKNSKFLKYLGGCFLNRMGVALYERLEDDSTLLMRVENVVNGKSVCSRIIAKEEFERLKEEMEDDRYEFGWSNDDVRIVLFWAEKCGYSLV